MPELPGLGGPPAICLITAATAAEFDAGAEAASESVRRIAMCPQLGVLSLAAVLEASGSTPHIVNLNRLYYQYAESAEAQSQTFAWYAAQRLASIQTGVYGFSTICSSYPLTIRIARFLRSLCPETMILLGGPQASVVDVATLREFPFVDLILRGEADQTIVLLLNELAGARHFETIPGLTWRGASRIFRNPNGPVIEDLDSLPTPAYHLTGELDGVGVASIELGRGCPFACTFCSTNDFFRRRFRLRSPARVIEDMRAIRLSHPQITDFDLVHDMFTVDRRRVVDFCEAMISSGEGLNWFCSARTDCVDDELLNLMARAGCRSVFFGVESGSARIQHIMNKRLDPRKAELMIDAAEAAGIASTVSLIAGFPEETRDDLRETVNMFMHSIRRPNSNPQFNLLAPLAETPVYELHKHELILEDLCSDMSHQSLEQDAADRELVRQHPAIFPNFYLIPTPHLDRELLFELREFLLMGTTRFRWLLAALDRTGPGMLDSFEQWREYRLLFKPGLRGSDLRQYYRTLRFCADFVKFARKHFGSASVCALLDYEEALLKAASNETDASPPPTLIPYAGELTSADIPVRSPGTWTLRLPWNLQAIIDCLSQNTNFDQPPGDFCYVTRRVSREINPYMVSEWVARLVDLCDGVRTVEQITEEFFRMTPEIGYKDRNFVCESLLTGIQQQGFISIYRSSADALASQPTDGYEREYSAISA